MDRKLLTPQARVGFGSRVTWWAVNKVFQIQLWALGFFTSHTPECLTEKACSDLNAEIQKLRNDVEFLKRKEQVLKRDKDEVLNRLSEVLSSKLRDNNPAIVDLSDKFRPNKLAEFANELYDNEWTEAFNYLEDKLGDEKDVIQHLLDILMEVYTTCRQIASTHWKGIVYHLTWGKSREADKEVLKAIKDMNKERASDRLPEVTEQCLAILRTIPSISQLHMHLSAYFMEQYVEGCVKLCWLMQSQDPPVVFVCSGWKSEQPATNLAASQHATYIQIPREEESVIQEHDKHDIHDTSNINHNAETGDTYDVISNTSSSQHDQTQSDEGVVKIMVDWNDPNRKSIQDVDVIESDDNDDFGSVGSHPNSETESQYEDNEIERPSSDIDTTGIMGNQNKYSQYNKHIGGVEIEIDDPRTLEDISSQNTIGTEHMRASLAFSEEDGQPTRRKVSKGETKLYIINESNKSDNLFEERTNQDASLEVMPFQKDLFREYTKRGQIVEYIVWPIMYLHEDGPILRKGVAQGSNI